ncbi:MAG: AI-2E family transporter [Devosia sp.]
MSELRTRRAMNRPFEVAVLFALSIGALYVGQAIFVPLVLAILVAFALTPIVGQARRLGLPQPAAVLLTVMSITGIALLAGYIMFSQLLNLAVELPQYQQTIANKLRALQGDGGEGPFGRLAKILEDMGNQFALGTSATQPSPVPVTIADRPASPLEGLTGVFGSILGPLATGALVFIFSVFLLFERVELRDRFLKLVSLGDLRTSTKVMDESAGRVSRYLLVQLGVNCSFGVLFGVGTFLLGVPNAMLWGLLAIILRYIPFVGTLAAVLFPAALAFAVDPGWIMLLGVIGVYLVLELITTNAIEPKLYGKSTGLSPMAVLVAAIFWATLWGMVGLVLATPLTVCLVVLGRYVPQLRFLDILLGSEPVLLPEERFYQRLIAGNVAEAVELSEAELKEGSATEFFDRVAIPALRLAAVDLQRDSSDLGRRRNVVDAIKDVVDEFDARLPSPVSSLRGPVVIIGGKTELDGAAASMLAHSLSAVGIETRQSPPMALERDGIVQLDLSAAVAVVLCYLDLHPEPYIRYAALRLHRKKAKVPVFACLLGAPETDLPDASTLGVHATALSIAAAREQIDVLLQTAEGDVIKGPPKPAAESHLDRMKRLAPQTEWLATNGPRIAETFRVPLAIVQFAPSDPGAATSSQRGLAERVLAAGAPVSIEDVALDKDAIDDPFLVENGFHSFAGVPLKLASGDVIGTLTLYDSSPRDFGPELGPLIVEAAALVSNIEARSG